MLDTLGVGSIIALLSVWAGYPLVVSVLAACRRRPVARPLSARPTVSFIIATRESDDAIAERVRDCLQAQYESSRLEVVVGIDSQRVTPPAVTPYLPPPVTVVRGDPPGGKAATLNAAVRASRGEILVFTDVYQRFDPDAVAALVEAFWDPQIGAVSGALQVPDAQGSRWVVGRYWRYERWLREQEARLHSAVGVTGSIYALRRSLWRALPAELLLDDVYVPMQVVLDGRRVGFCASARAWDVRRTNARREYRRKVRTQTGVVQLCAWLPELFNPRRNPIWLQFLFHKVLRLLTPYWLALAAVWGLAAAWGYVTAQALPVQRPVVTVAAVAVTAVLLAARRSALARHVGEAVISLVLVQAAVVVAAANGVRGRWDIWQR